MRNGDFLFFLLGSAALLASSPAPAQGDTRQQLRLPEQRLDLSLRVIATRFGRNISIPSELVAGRSAPAIDGLYSFEQAVAELLRDSGLTAVPAGRGLAVRRSRAATASDAAPGSEGDDIVVTGSRIRGVAPAGARVVAISRDDIERSGYATTQQIVQALPQNFGGGPNEGTSGFTDRNNAGANLGLGSSVNLRGLGTTSTLTLVDGNRIALGGVSGTFVDLSLIPSSAIERIEVLADGASAIYGSDAVGGVVNVKLRNRFRGAESRARFGSAKGFDEWQLGQLAGLGWSSGSLMLGYEYYHRDNLAAADRDFATEDLRAFGGPDYRRTFANPGTIIAADGRVFGIPAGQDGKTLTAGQLLAGQPNKADGRANSDILPRQDRHSVVGALSQNLGSWLRLTAQGFFADRQSLVRTPPSNRGNIAVPTTNPFYVDPIGTGKPVIVNYSFEQDLGIKTNRASVRAYSGVGGLEATLGKWRASLGGSYSTQREELRTTNVPNYYWLAKALSDTNPATAYNLFGDGSHTARSTIDKVRGWYESIGESRIWSAAFRADGPLIRLPGDVAHLAVGAEFRRERYNGTGTNYDSTATPVDAGSAGFPISRSVAAAFAELALPLVRPGMEVSGIEALDLSVAGRVEHYSDFGTTFNPRFGLSWRAGGGVTLRANYGRSFRAPGFLDIRTGKGTASIAPLYVPDPASPTGTTPVLALFGNIPDLGPEKASTWTVGATLTPDQIPGLRLDVGYFNIAYRDRIGSAGINYLSFLSNRSVYGELIVDNPPVADIAKYYTDENFFNPFGIAPGQVRAIIDGRTRNLSSVDLEGLDFDLGYTHAGSRRSIEVGISGTWLLRNRQKITAGSPTVDILSTIGNPVDMRLRGRLAVADGPWSAAAFVNHMAGYANNGVKPVETVSSWTTVDLNLSYSLDRFLTGTRIALSATNVFDRQPPYVNLQTVQSASGFDPENASAIGRLVALQLVTSW
ncbi:TonB-dependent receptor [Sphingomonas koreensis]|uniref:TonB-dependent receptor n=1 Tax=Sphingomonas koreensis TaxID=93064 RepID=UPI000B049D4B|nr:TonB-dependent receptor [Sphingomonas koreensis]PJI87189.1 iron complex outermembrane receptor protein [Sphingomonas koreensis]